MRHISDAERRARLAVAHAVAPWARVADPVAAARAMVALHATEAPTVYLSAHARVDGLRVADVEAAVYAERTLVKQLAMRRTVFVMPRDVLPAVWASASARVAEAEYRRTGKLLVESGITDNGPEWMDRARRAIVDLIGPDGLSTTSVRQALPDWDVKVRMSPGTRWGGDFPVLPRILTWMGARADLVRGENDGHWRLARQRWFGAEQWLGPLDRHVDARAGYAELVRRWLERFGPGTEADLVWWLGSTKGAVRQALSDICAVEVSLDGGGIGWVGSADDGPPPQGEPWAALLPILDPTTMGWRDRDWYLNPADTRYLFDSAGNAGTTAWWNGRIVGCWVQDVSGVVRVVPRADVGADGTKALNAEAERLTEWLDGVIITSVYSSLQMRAERLP